MAFAAELSQAGYDEDQELIELAKASLSTKHDHCPECVVLKMIHQRGGAISAAGHGGDIGYWERTLPELAEPIILLDYIEWSVDFGGHQK